MVSSICIFSKFDANICTCIFSRVLKLGYRQSVMNKLKGEKMDMTQTICMAKFLSCSTWAASGSIWLAEPSEDVCSQALKHLSPVWLVWWWPTWNSAALPQVQEERSSSIASCRCWPGRYDYDLCVVCWQLYRSTPVKDFCRLQLIFWMKINF